MKRHRRAARTAPISDKPVASIRHSNNRIVWCIGVSATVSVAAYLFFAFYGSTSQHQLPQDQLPQAEAAMTIGDFATARQMADQVLASNPSSSRALLVAGFAAAGQQRIDDAIQYLERVPDEDLENKVIALGSLGKFFVQLGYAARAETSFRRVLQLDPTSVEAREGLIGLLVLESRNWEAEELILPLLQHGRIQSNHLMVASSPEIWLADVSHFTEICLTAVPDDPLPLLHKAGEAWRLNDTVEAESLLRKIIQSHPDNAEAQSQLGRILAESPDSSAFLTWRSSLAKSVEEHPAIWFDYGLWAQSHEQLAAAARCYWEALSRRPNYTAANYHLSQVLIALGKSKQAQPFAERAGQLAKLQRMIEGIKSEWAPDKIRELVELLEAMGRPWEAAGWCQVELQQNSNDPWSSAKLLELRPYFSRCKTYTLDTHNLTKLIDLSGNRLPQWPTAPSSPQYSADGEHLAASIEFVDSAADVGIDFTYHNGAMANGKESLLEMDGGGVAVLDYDNDGWPDLYFTQGGVLPPQSETSEYGDRLYRNLGDGRFRDVTAEAGLGDTGYSQGVTVGDFDNDGFPDLYVANIGPNRLYQNNGDGRFRDVTSRSGVAGNAWTSSCLLADLNGDTLPDIYAVNYLGGDDLYTRLCEKKPGRRCAPIDFPAEQDRLYQNLGDGRFEDVTERCGIVAPDGRGLGIVAADLDGSHRLSLFVANDMSANFLFFNQTQSPGGPLAFSERGVLSGVAFDAQGVAQACMGIAVGDANDDGLLDLFVTNFYREANNFFVQHAKGLFSDECRAANLWEAGFAMLGWGTQFIDFDLDGRLDLVVANGHVHDPLDADTPYRMPPQCFRNQGEGRFELLPVDSLGGYFRGNYLGRALARLDWNRDGLEDICSSHLDTPYALLTNRTEQHGHFLSLRLVGVASDRDALGTSVRVTTGEHTRLRQLTAGDGFQVSNQRQLVFGLGASQRIDLLDVRWPSGLEQQFHDVPTDSQILLVEGQVWEAIESELKSYGTFPDP